MSADSLGRDSTWRRTRSGIWSLAEAMAWPLGLLLLAAVIGRTSGIAAYGPIILLTAALGFVPLASVGVQTVLVQLLSGTAGRDQSAASSSGHLIYAALWLSGTVLLTLLGLVLCIYTVRADHGLAMIEPSGRPHFAFALCLGIIAACADQVAIGVLKGRFMFKAVAILEVVNRTCQVAATAVVAWLLLETKWLVVALAAAMLLGSALRLALAVNAVRPLRTEHLYETTISIVRSGRWIVVQSIGGYPYMGLDRLIVGYLLGPASVGLYGICVQFAQFAHMLPAAFFQPLMPAVSRMRSEGNVDEERVTVRRAGALCISASALIGITLVLATPWALRYWLGRDPVAEEIQSMQVASLAAALMGSLSAAHYAFMGRGQFFSVSVLNLLAGILFSLALFIFGETYGVAGAAWSRVIFPIIIGVGFLVLILMTRSRSSFMS